MSEKQEQAKEQPTLILKNPINPNSNQKDEVLLKIANKLENITSDTNSKTDINKLVKHLKSIVKNIYKYINDQKPIPSKDSSSSSDSPPHIDSFKLNFSISQQNNFSINSNIITQKTEIIDGNKYEGEFKNGKKDGKGTMTYKNGYIYIGEWKNGYKHGKGVYINSKSQDKFEGEFKNGKADGKGQALYNNGDKYEAITMWYKKDPPWV